MCYLSLRQYNDAIADLSKAIAVRPDYYVNYLNRGKAYYLLGQKNLGDADTVKARALMSKLSTDN
ncbi:MAG: tetratricopeptide repeat protein [Cyanobacteria bacterium REEB67]|nr:tetratricopeptide repeat protein [Cyanobacteria bacterium REEB67]